jgi:hypothetical protein
MPDEILRDAAGRTVGFLRTTPSGRQEAYDANRTYRGYFDAEHKLTKDGSGATVAKGNDLTALIFRRR